MIDEAALLEALADVPTQYRSAVETILRYRISDETKAAEVNFQ